MSRILPFVFLGCLVGCMEAVPPVDYEQEAFQRGAEKVEACRQSECARLDLDGAQLQDYSVLDDMPHVTKLMMSRTNITDLADIAQMTQLKELHISWTAIDDLSGLSAFPNLELLHANNLEAAPDYTPIYRLAGLKELSLDARAADGLGFVRNMRQLESLYIMDGQVSDLAPLAGNRTIKELVIRDLSAEDETPLLKMRNLRMLDTGYREVGSPIRDALEDRGVTVSFPAVVVC